MKALKIVGFTLLSIIGIIVFGIVVGLGTILAHTFLQWLLLGRGEYLLGVSKGPNWLEISMLSVIAMYGIYKGTLRLLGYTELQACDNTPDAEVEDAEPQGILEKVIFMLFSNFASINSPSSKLSMSKVIIFICLPALLIATYCGITDYSILYTDTIKVSTPWNPNGVIYNYSDIKDIDVRIDDNGNNSYSPCYRVVFRDDKSVDLMGDTIFGSNGEDTEDILWDFDEKLRIQGVVKTVDTTNFEEYAQGLDISFTSKIKRLFVN